MNVLRRVAAVLAALTLSFFAAGAFAQNVKYFTLNNITISAPPVDGKSTVSAVFTNIETGNSTFNAISLTANSSSVTFVVGTTVTIDGVAVSPSNVFLQNNNKTLVVTGLSPVKKGKYVTVKATVSGPDNGCLTWHGSAWTGSVSSPSQIFVQSNADPISSIGTGCKLSLVPPSSLARTTTGASAQFGVNVFVTDSNDAPVPNVAIPFTLSGSAGCSFTTNPTGTTGTALTGLVADLGASAMSCTLTATTTNPSLSDSKVVSVFDGVLGCTSAVFDALDLPVPVNSSTSSYAFDASEGDATDPGDTGFLAGVRGSDPDKGVCANADGTPVKVNYEVVNNIPTGGSTQSDPVGNTVYVGSYSITWDANQTDATGHLLRPVFAVMVTMQPEWGAWDTGLPTHATLICTASPCSTTPLTTSGAINTGWKKAPACLSTLVKHSSLPFTDATMTTREKGCVASERWDVVATTECAGSPPSGAIPPEGRCLKPTATLIMGNDPVFGR